MDRDNLAGLETVVSYLGHSDMRHHPRSSGSCVTGAALTTADHLHSFEVDGMCWRCFGQLRAVVGAYRQLPEATGTRMLGIDATRFTGDTLAWMESTAYINLRPWRQCGPYGAFLTVDTDRYVQAAVQALAETTSGAPALFDFGPLGDRPLELLDTLEVLLVDSPWDRAAEFASAARVLVA